LPVAFNGCEAWSLTLWEEYKLRVFENRGVRMIFERIGEWRKLHNEALYALHSSSNVIQVIKSRIMRWAGNVARMTTGDVHTVFRGET
jgi:hypothetical protein